ncbi:MAG TPA: response regulator [Planctomycetota bacterium]|nr:response regulator [Planctomycetota bacterium]
MSREPLRLLLVEDSSDDAELILREFRRAGFEPACERVQSAEALRSALSRGPWDLVVSDYQLGGFTGRESLAMVRGSGQDLPFILVSGAVGEDVAVDAMKAGASDYVMKDKLVRLGPAVRRELADAEVRRRRRKAEEELKTAYEDLERRVRERTAELSEANARAREELDERRRLEEDRNRMFVHLLRGQKLQAIGQLAAGVAHEINNPVGWILSNLGAIEEYFVTLADLLEKTTAAAHATPGPEGERLREEIGRLRMEAESDFVLQDLATAVRDSKEGAIRIRDIVASLKSFARPDDQEPEETDLVQLLEGAIKLSASELKFKAEVVRHYSPLPHVSCRPRQIEQVFINLLVNAAQAIPGKGKVTVSAECNGREVVVRVGDTGSGIPPELRKRLFEPFFTTKPVGKGTGLGLHVAYKIVRAHGGRIEVDSTPGSGTVMTVRLPLSKAAPKPRAVATGKPGEEEPLVVVVDDDPPSLRVLERALSGERLRLMSTEDPRQALEWVESRSVRLILADQRMPEMLGTTLLEAVAAVSPETHRLLITAYPESPEIQGAGGRCAEHIIPKPWDERDLLQAIRSRLDPTLKEGK